MIIPLRKSHERVAISRQDSDTTLYMNLMESAEQLLKLIASALVSGIQDSKSNDVNSKYSQNYILVRANGLGDWCRVLENITVGPASHFLASEFHPFSSELTQTVSNPSWQYGALVAINNCLKVLDPSKEDLPTKTQLKNWGSLFTKLRNSARGHGYPNAGETTKICENLEISLKLITENFSLFKVPWIYISKNISGSYRITSLGETSNRQKIQEAVSELTLKDGVYLFLNKPFRIDMIESNAEAIDFYFPNGGFTDKKYECISYLTGRRILKESTPFLDPPGHLPPSETVGLGKLYLTGKTFNNLPSSQSIYITRDELEHELESVLMMDDTNPIVTLSGIGGIGKTSLSLKVLNKICDTDRFTAIIWFSARDIDLHEHGPATVEQQVYNETDIAVEFSNLIATKQSKINKNDAKALVEKELRESGDGTNGKILFVMDNFETLRNPLQVYRWLATHVRNPNKILITTRFRDFNADFHIDVKGMNEGEFHELVDQVAEKLKIKTNLLSKDFLKELYQESAGHPYVVKVLLGEVSANKQTNNIRRIVASKDEILTALFERTYSSISLPAKRIFITLCGWRTILAEISIEAVLNREGNELIDIGEAIEELFRYSFIEKIESEIDNSVFIFVPLTAFEFGKKKLSVSPLKTRIQLDLNFLNNFGVVNTTSLIRGLKPVVEQFFKGMALIVKKDRDKLNELLPSIELVCRKFPYGWKLLAKLYREEVNNTQKAIESLQNYVSDYRVKDIKEKVSTWELISKLYSIQNDPIGEAQSLFEICNMEKVSFSDLSNAAGTLLGLIKTKKIKFKKEELFFYLNPIAESMHNRIEREGFITDYVTLSWIYYHLFKKDKAEYYAIEATKRDPISPFQLLGLADALKKRFFINIFPLLQ